MTSEMVKVISEGYNELVLFIRDNQKKIASLKKRIDELEKKVEG